MRYRSAGTAALAVLASAAAVVALGAAPPDVPRLRAPVTVAPVRDVQLGCPATPADEETSVLEVSGMSGIAPVPTELPGSLRIAELARPAGDELATETRPGRRLRRTVTPADGSALVVAATGSLAPGAVAALVSTVSSPRLSGLSAAWCAPAAPEWVFDGVDTRVGASAQLTLSNLSAAVAVIDLQFFGSDGPVDAPGASGIAVGPQTQISLNLARFAPGVGSLTVHVSAERGAVEAAVRTSLLRVRTPLGVDWVPASASPSTDLVVGPGVTTAGRQRLSLTNVSTREALVSVELADKDGAFVPTQLRELRIAPGTVSVHDLRSITKGRAATVRVTANVPLTGALTTIERLDAADFVVAGATQALDEPAVVPLLPAAEPVLVLTATDPAGSSVGIDSYDAAGKRVSTARVNLDGRTTRSWRPRAVDRVAYLVVTPSRRSGVHAVAYFRSTAGLAALPAISGMTSVTLPAIVPAP